MYLLQPVFGGLTATLIGSLFFLFVLALWTLPASSFQRGVRMDPTQRRIVGAFLGIGLGMFGGLAVAALCTPSVQLDRPRRRRGGGDRLVLSQVMSNE